MTRILIGCILVMFPKIIIEEGVSIGSGSVIMCGIKIGKNSTIGAGSLVLSNVPNNTIYVNQRKIIKIKKWTSD